MTHPLLTWLEAQLDDAECVADAAHGARWRWDYEEADRNGDVPSWAELRSGDDVVIACEGQLVMFGTADAEHIALHDPRAVLTDIAAKRQVIALLGVAERHLEERRRNAPHYRLVITAELPRDALFLAVQHLASAYSHLPGYDQSWGPQ